MLEKLILNKKNLQMQYLKKLFQMLLLMGIVLMLGSVAFYMRDFELVIILFFLFIYFAIGVIKNIKDKHLELAINTFLIEKLTTEDR